MTRILTPAALRAALRAAFDTSRDPGEYSVALMIETLVALHSQGHLIGETIDRILAEAEPYRHGRPEQ